ncbi:MAG: hypothetical protein ACUVWX_04030 [Kiritimatiellia bacterium]
MSRNRNRPEEHAVSTTVTVRKVHSSLLPLVRSELMVDTPPTGEAFRPEWIDFQRGIRVGNLEPHQRITRILRYHLEHSCGTAFVTDRWGRGVYWQWICWLPRQNREAKPVSNKTNFGCAKLFISVERELEVFKAGLQVERGQLRATPGEKSDWILNKDWDWHRLMKQCASGTTLERELRRLIRREGFIVEVGDWENNAVFDVSDFNSAEQIRRAASRAAPTEWAGFQLCYRMPKREVLSCNGYELVNAIWGIFLQVIPAMNECMQIKLPCSPPPTWA